MICVFPGLLMLIYAISMILDVFIPIMGRSLMAENPEVPISMTLTGGAILFVLMTVGIYDFSRPSPITAIFLCICVFQGSLVYRSQRINILFKVVFATVALLYAVLAFTPYGGPYSFDVAAPRTRRVHFNVSQYEFFL